MVLKLSVSTRDIERRLSGLAVSQVPYAAAMGMNDVALSVKREEPAALERDLDRPARFTKAGVAVRFANKRRLSASVGFKPIQAQYLALQATGGTRRPKRRAIPVPAGIRLNKFGNMPRGALARQLARPDTFAGSVKGVPGIWKRKRRAGGGGKRRGSGPAGGAASSVKLLIAFEPRASYRPRLKFVPRASASIRKGIGPAIAKQLRRAVQTAR